MNSCRACGWRWTGLLLRTTALGWQRSTHGQRSCRRSFLKKANAKQGFEELADEIDALREEKQAILLEDANRTAMKQRLEELEAFLDEHQEPVTDYDEGMVRRLIERITVFEDHLEFEFKCGLETEVQM